MLGCLAFGISTKAGVTKRHSQWTYRDTGGEPTLELAIVSQQPSLSSKLNTSKRD